MVIKSYKLYDTMVTMLVTKLYITIVTYHPWGKSQLRLDVVGLSAGRQSLASEFGKRRRDCPSQK